MAIESARARSPKVNSTNIKSVSTGFFAGALAPALLLLLGSIVVASALVTLFIMGRSLSTGVLPVDASEAQYVKHAWLSGLHFLPGIAFTLLGPLQFMHKLRQRWPRLHRILGRVFVLSGLVTAVTAILLNMTLPPIGGATKTAAVLTFSVAQIAALGIALRAILKRNIAQHRAWMLRAFAIGLGVATMRYYFIPVYLIWGIPGDLHIGLGMWIGFGINVLAAEFILRKTRIF
jgi:uncharacterized membrane protein